MNPLVHETWKAHLKNQGESHLIEFPDHYHALLPSLLGTDGELMKRRAILASQAPHLLRVLLMLEWSGEEWDSQHEEYFNVCPWCKAQGKSPFAEGKHRERCPIYIALRDAGAYL